MVFIFINFHKNSEKLRFLRVFVLKTALFVSFMFFLEKFLKNENYFHKKFLIFVKKNIDI